MDLLLRASFDTISGYGNDAVDIAIFLAREGVDVTCFPASILPPLPREFTKLLERDPRGRKEVALTFAPPFDVKPWEFAHFAQRAYGWSMWERARMRPSDMEGHGWDMRRQHRWWSGGHSPVPEGVPRRYDLDAMLVTCPMNVESFAALDPHCRYTVVPCGIDPKKWPTRRRDPSTRMRFGMIGMLAGRKDPFMMLKAWKELKDDEPEFDAELWLHTLAPGLHPKLVDWYPDTRLTGAAMSVPELIDWYHDVDVLVSTSRGEGNNKPAMEHMATGGTVIATDWSGHKNWLTNETGYPLRGTMQRDEYLADKDHLKELLLHTWKERAEVADKGEHAARFVKEALSWPTIIKKRLLPAMT